MKRVGVPLLGHLFGLLPLLLHPVIIPDAAGAGGLFGEGGALGHDDDPVIVIAGAVGDAVTFLFVLGDPVLRPGGGAGEDLISIRGALGHDDGPGVFGVVFAVFVSGEAGDAVAGFEVV